MSIKVTYNRIAAPLLTHVVDFKTKSKLLSSIPPLMDRGVSGTVDTNLTTINTDYLIPDGVTVVAIVVAPVIDIPYLVFIDTDGLLKVIPAVYKNTLVNNTFSNTNGSIIGSVPADNEARSKDLFTVIDNNSKGNYSLVGSSTSSVTSTVVTLNDPDMVHNRTVIRGISNQDRIVTASVPHWDVLAIIVTLAAPVDLPLWYFENIGTYGKFVRYTGIVPTNKLIFTVDI